MSIFFPHFSVEARDTGDDLSFSISTAFSIMYGSISEYVFDDGEKASELKWDLKPLILVGTKISYSIYSFESEGSLFCGINEDTGSIRDYDWDTLTGEKSEVFENTSGIKTRYGEITLLIDIRL